ncbi:hypothetical protein ACFFWB_26740 [Flavobacterium procerum]|uniref:hypothetical protein n=1 Tax=Flavobacterium procerum TaxID=1455569 RepID=UPI0035F04E11
MLAVIDTHSGNEFPLEDIGFPLVEKFDGIKDIQIFKRNGGLPIKEGFIIKFRKQFSNKKLNLTNTFVYTELLLRFSNVNIWEYLKNKTNHWRKF